MPILFIVGGFAIAALIALRELRKIGYSTTELTLQIGESAPLVMVLVVKPWFKTSFQLVGGDISFIHFDRSIITIDPPGCATSAIQPDGIVTVTGNKAGSATIIVKGSSKWGEHEEIVVSVDVLGS